VSAQLTWDELETADDEAALLPSPGEALRRLDAGGDLFAPVLSTVQQLPA
jgi:hypothetical protein